MAWNFWFQPLACLIFFTSAMAESNRMPFDLPECEQELVGGYHTEYGGFRFAMFFLGEYVHVITVSFLTSILFFGGWHFPWIADAGERLRRGLAREDRRAAVKVFCVIVLIMLIRWTIPRFRFDQLMGLAWKVLIPLALVNVVFVMTVLQFGWNPWWLPASSFAVCGGRLDRHADPGTGRPRPGAALTHYTNTEPAWARRRRQRVRSTMRAEHANRP